MKWILSLLCLALLCGCGAKSYYADIGDHRDVKATALYQDGLAMAQKGAHRQAIDVYKNALRADPNLAEVYLGLSRSHFAVGDYEMAMFFNIQYSEVQWSRDDAYKLNAW